jgi:hypothetical protein
MLAAVAAAVVMTICRMALPEDTRIEALVSGLATVAVGTAAFTGTSFLMRSPELGRIWTLVRRTG